MGKRDKEIPYEVVIQERKRVDLYGNVVYYIYWFDKYGYNITNEWKFWSKGPKKKYDRVNRYLTDSWLKEYCGNNNLKISRIKYVKIVPKEIKKIPVRGYRKLAGIWNCETCNGKGWYRLFNYFKYKPDICYIKNIGRDKNGNTRYEISLFNATMNVTRYFNLWRMKPGMHAMITNEYGVLDIIKEKFDNINIVEYSGIWI